MPLRILLDENLRGPLWNALNRDERVASGTIVVRRVGDEPDLPLASQDPDILRWIQRRGYVLVSTDLETLPMHLANHLQEGGHCPGVFLVRLPCPISQLVEWFLLIADDGNQASWHDRIVYIP